MRPGAHRRTTAVALTLTLAAVVMASGCGSDSGTRRASAQGTSGTLAPVQSGAVKISAIDNFFKADAVTVTAGSTVTWTNAGRNDHNVRPSDGGSFGVETADFGPGTSYTATFATPGTYHYFCSIHGTDARGM